MSIRNSHFIRRRFAPVPALFFGVTAILAQSVYAGSPSCFRPTLEIFSQSSAPSSSTTGTASAKLNFKPPFVIEGVATAQGFLDQDSGAVGSMGAAGTSRFWTTTCEGWSYGWSATGSVAGSIKAKTAKAGSGSAEATCSFAATAAGDLNPPAKDSKTAQSATSGGGSVSISVGGGDTGPGYSLGLGTGTATVTPSANAAGDVNSLFDGPKSNCGAGSETLVVVSLYAYVNAQANGCLTSSAPHISKSTASTGGYAGAAVVQTLYAISPAGISYGMAVYPQTGIWRQVTRNENAQWKPGPWKPPFGQEFVEKGPVELKSTEPPMPPSPGGRTDNDGGFHKAQ